MENIFALLSCYGAMGIVCGALAGHIAREKGYSYTGWFACGFFFNILGLIAAAGLPLSSQKHFHNAERDTSKRKPPL